ncbi:NRDE family protein [Terrimonas pollutisoli]|uniref:NRDE family protein n=1 Tax=Terrimonas pollutisoli TaxID=3034147 RepID=UPI0023EC9A0C|nr:NRDE family protein [Terrimonas sp. H1YJ31]
MCTVTYIPCREKYFITSNRDEKYSRSTAIAPVVYEVNQRKLIFPKDADAGGSWIALDENGNTAVLLNGAFEKHEPTPPYRQSRGQVFLAIVTAQKPVLHFQVVDLSGIEPFTIIILDRHHLHECRWDGADKYSKQLKKHQPYIWSSVTLYDSDTIEKREKWFVDFLKLHGEPTQKDILEFHRFAGDGDPDNDLLMERDGMFSTVSITNILLTSDRASMKYIDIKNNRTTERKIELLNTMEMA